MAPMMKEREHAAHALMAALGAGLTVKSAINAHLDMYL